MGESNGGCLEFVVIIAVLGLFLFGMFKSGEEVGHKHGYRDGQIDAINGRIAYELRTNPDKTTEWVRRPNATAGAAEEGKR